MGTTGKKELKPFVAAWLDGLDACFEKERKWDLATGRPVKGERDVFIHPAAAEHTGRLHHLVQADFSPIVQRSKLSEFLQMMHDASDVVPLERKEFPAGYYWTVIKKWDRWRKLRVIPRIKKYVKGLVDFWEKEWHVNGGPLSPFTQVWIRHENRVSVRRFIYNEGEPSKDERAKLDREFPAVAVLRRIASGEPARASDIEVLEPFASPWCKKNAGELRKEVGRRLGAFYLEPRPQGEEAISNKCVNDIRDGIGDLYAAVLSQDIQARHNTAMTIVSRWENGWGARICSFLHALGNEKYLYELREVMPLSRVGDPFLEQEKRNSDAMKASKKRKRPRGEAIPLVTWR